MANSQFPFKEMQLSAFMWQKGKQNNKKKDCKENAIRKEIRPKFMDFYVISNKYNG